MIAQGGMCTERHRPLTGDESCALVKDRVRVLAATTVEVRHGQAAVRGRELLEIRLTLGELTWRSYVQTPAFST